LRELPRNLWVLIAAQMFNQSSGSIVIMVGGLVGGALASDARLATLPVALFVVGGALVTVPAAMAMRHWGRKRVFIAGTLAAMAGAIAAALAVQHSNFFGFCGGTFLIGASQAIVQQYRFAAVESVPIADVPRAASWQLSAGLVTAFVGPELAVRAQNLVGSAYVGSVLAILFLNMAGLCVLALYRNVDCGHEAAGHEEDRSGGMSGRLSLGVAILGAAAGYSVMSFVMTATPIDMHVMQGHSLDSVKWVIQSHIVAMYLPSLFVGRLIMRFDVAPVMAFGCFSLLACIGIGYTGIEIVHYWVALVLLGIGWNFLFVGGTTLLASTCLPSERYRIQGMNEFIVFGAQAVASLSAGWVLGVFGWRPLLLSCVPVVLGFLMLLVYWQHFERRPTVSYGAPGAERD